MMYDDKIAAAAKKWGLDAALVTADAQHESALNPFAVGDGGLALGLMQVHRVAAEDVGLADEWDKLKAAIGAGDEVMAVTLGFDIGCAYLARMLAMFAGNTKLALMAYNQGPGVIGRAVAYSEAVLALLPPA